jgi:hypothetical protein
MALAVGLGLLLAIRWPEAQRHGYTPARREIADNQLRHRFSAGSRADRLPKPPPLASTSSPEMMSRTSHNPLCS